MSPLLNKMIGRNIDVNVFDALYLNVKIMKEIDKMEQYFVIRMEDKTKHIYKDAKGLFEKTKPVYEYELVEITREIKTEYSKIAKHKNSEKIKKRVEKRKITNNPYWRTKIYKRRNKY